MSDKCTQISDEELWIVKADDGSWELPISAIPVEKDGKEYLACSDIIGFNMAQWTAVNNRLSPASTGTSGTFTFVPRIGMPTVATKAPGINAKFYIKWDMASPPKPKLNFVMDEQIETPEPDASTRQFIDHIVWKARALSKEDVLFIWSVITEELPKWITERKRCVSFGYFTIWAVPYRANWKQILLSKFPKIASTMRMPKKERDARLSLTDVELSLQHTDLVEFHTDTKTVGWSIECVPTKFWQEFVQDMEAKRRKHLGAAGYAKFWSRLIWVLQGVIYDIFGAFVAKTTFPCAEPVRSDRYGNYSFGSCMPNCSATPVRESIPETLCVYPDASRQVIFHGTPVSLAAMETPNEVVHEMQPLQLATEDVRNGRRILPTNGGGGT